ncbi:MAG TPA: ABC transporter ATP-binding protein, partial [Candidatus Marinimicrobia bacterium]|nr:ABC transporter ATP-binding protein [Candidatus Neomarinimicrobiota bacterium]
SPNQSPTGLSLETKAGLKLIKPVLELKNVSTYYPGKQSYFKKQKFNQANYNINLKLRPGEIHAIVGESGSGKSTLGNTIVGLVDDFEGEFIFQGSNYNPRIMSDLRSEIQIIFQDSLSSLNPRMKIGTAIIDVIKHHHPNTDVTERMDELFFKVNLSIITAGKYPHELSGGQRQRACIARALAVEPKILICDEIVSALDVSVQAKILNLLLRLVEEDHLAILFTTHDLHVVESFAHHVVVMKDGKIVEKGVTKDIFTNPQNAYTKTLLQSIPEKVNS